MNPEEYFHEYLSGTMSDDRREEFLAQLRTDATLRGAMVHYAIETHLMLKVASRIKKQESLPEAWIGSRRATRSFRQGWLAAAAAVIVALGVWWMTEGRGSRVKGRGDVVARVAEMRGECLSSFPSSLAPRPSKIGDEVRAGTRIETGPGGRVTLAWVDHGIRVQLEANSSLDTRHATLCFLARGGLTVEVDPSTNPGQVQKAGSPFTVQTPHARVEVTGTAFGVAVEPAGTRVEVTKGRVRLTRLADGASVEVPAGHVATAAGGTPLEARPRTAPATRRVVFAHDFDAIPPDQWIQGELVRLAESRGEVTVVASMPCKPGSANFNPDQQMDLPAKFSVPHHFEVRIRIRSEKPGKVGVAHFPENQVRTRNFAEHFFSGDLDVGSQWRDIVLRPADLKPYRREGHTRDLAPGLGITGFQILGFGAGRLFVDRYEVVEIQKE